MGIRMRLSRKLAVAGAAAALLGLSAVTADAAPPFAGSSYATTRGPGNSVLGASGGPVRVGAHLPPSLACSQVVSVDTGAGYFENPGLNALNAAPVRVKLAAGPCGPQWRQEWVSFTVPNPVSSDILRLTFEDAAGRTLYSEKVAISSNGSPSGGDD